VRWAKMNMRDIPERDWRYLRSIQAEMLEELSRRICDEVREALAATSTSETDLRDCSAAGAKAVRQSSPVRMHGLTHIIWIAPFILDDSRNNRL
jgi:hypothetical protein